jgi:hypothetical protein
MKLIIEISRSQTQLGFIAVALAKRHNDRAFLKLNRAPSFYHYGALSPLHKATEGHNAIKIERISAISRSVVVGALSFPLT